jgi:hypothetical protein
MNRTLLIHVVIAAVVLIAVTGAYAFWFNTVQQQSNHARVLAGEVENKQQDQSRIAQAQAQAASLTQDEASISSHFVAPADIVPFLEALQKAGTFYGSTVSVVSVSADPATARGKLNLSLSIIGPFAAVSRTLGSLEYSTYDMTLTSLTFDTPGPDTKGNRVWTAAAVFSVGTGVVATTTGVAHPIPASANASGL